MMPILFVINTNLFHFCKDETLDSIRKFLCETVSVSSGIELHLLK